VIHRDIRSSNVLLTGALSAKVAGFGLARMADDGPDATHMTTRAMGTAGYVDPEYMVTLQLTDKSDVYSFGVLLVELMTGRPPIERRPNLEPRATTKWVRTERQSCISFVAIDWISNQMLAYSNGMRCRRCRSSGEETRWLPWTQG
jgi:serine/threonine protein kinase